ncbi:hypothetical protein M422DRAFT_252895 [Sphaerobolus stellatus SS14]|uniref:Uncharacterized protein n=1 Tax=Sphaerobolus stellatus (strain SS14) TaxID=990650 RepID=A0A0C9VXM2_SPHS4|nr:hypothetical protein M422DRAFT_252895 [Sphaerobolus stellatus SS14]
MEFKDSDGEYLSMSNIIKNVCIDGWEGGTGGYKNGPIKVFALDGELCQRSSQKCRGSFLCSLRNPKPWEGYERWKYDFEPFRELFIRTRRNMNHHWDMLLARDHIHDGKLVDGQIEQRPCTAGLTIYSPLNKMVRKAIVIPEPKKPHNHPSYSAEKLTVEAEEVWRAAVRAAGPLGKTVGQIWRALLIL